jgi:hypothetical protein
MEPEKAYMAVFDGPEGKFPEVEWKKDRITLYGWSGSVAQVLLEGTRCPVQSLYLRCQRASVELGGKSGRRRGEHASVPRIVRDLQVER